MLTEPKILDTSLHRDHRGGFIESYNKKILLEQIGSDIEFVQDNLSFNHQGVLRGLHYQIAHQQGKLLHLVEGVVRDVVVDMRSSSKNFGRVHTFLLDSQKDRQLWIPEGFAHGFYVVSENATLLYKMTNYWVRNSERCLLWNDPELEIDWGITHPVTMSEKDKLGMLFRNCD